MGEFWEKRSMNQTTSNSDNEYILQNPAPGAALSPDSAGLPPGTAAQQEELQRLYLGTLIVSSIPLEVAVALVAFFIDFIYTRWLGGVAGQGIFFAPTGHGVGTGIFDRWGWGIEVGICLPLAHCIAMARCRKEVGSALDPIVETIKHNSNVAAAATEETSTRGDSSGELSIKFWSNPTKSARCGAFVYTFVIFLAVEFVMWMSLHRFSLLRDQLITLIWMLLILFALVPQIMRAAYSVNHPYLRADERGISGYHYHGRFRRSVAWEQIATCEIVTTRDSWHAIIRKTTSTILIFKNIDGKVLLRFGLLLNTPQTDRDRLTEFIRVRLRG